MDGLVGKRRWNGIFNWHGEIHDLWTTARTKKQAITNFVIRLVEILDLDPKKGRGAIRGYFMNDDKPNWEIKEGDFI